MALKLTVPSVSDKPDPSVETRAVYVEEWIEALPYANPTAMTKSFLGAVHKLNRCPVKPATRLALMEHYLQPYQHLLERRESQDVARSVAAFEKHRADSDAGRQIAVEMAYGYKLVVAGTVGKKSLFGKSKELATALQRAELFLSFALMHSYDEYLPTPPNLWRELSELYNYAVRCGLQDHVSGASKLRPEFRQSVPSTYKRILLTSLVDPYHLYQGDIWKVFAELGECCGAATLEPAREADKPSGLFVVRYGLDDRPTPYGEEKAELGEERFLLLDANPVIVRLQEQLSGEELDMRRRQLIGRMIRSLGLPPKRHTPRESARGTVDLASGISALHYFLAGGPGVTSAAAPTDSIEIGDTGQSTLAGPSYHTEPWEIIDKGPGGVGVLKNARPSIPVGVGEVLGLSFDDGIASGWNIGVVRWLNVADNGEYHAGIQILANQAEPVTLSGEDAAPSSQGGAGALALPRLLDSKNSSLLAPRGSYEKGRMLTAKMPGLECRLRAGSLVEVTETYERFGYEILDP